MIVYFGGCQSIIIINIIRGDKSVKIIVSCKGKKTDVSNVAEVDKI